MNIERVNLKLKPTGIWCGKREGKNHWNFYWGRGFIADAHIDENNTLVFRIGDIREEYGGLGKEWYDALNQTLTEESELWAKTQAESA